jgi:hypothetical protein
MSVKQSKDHTVSSITVLFVPSKTDLCPSNSPVQEFLHITYYGTQGAYVGTAACFRDSKYAGARQTQTIIGVTRSFFDPDFGAIRLKPPNLD